MNTLTPNRILQEGDEYRNNGAWKPVPKDDFGLQVMFTTYTEVRRPSENVKTAPDEKLATGFEGRLQIAVPISPSPAPASKLSKTLAGEHPADHIFGTCGHCEQEFASVTTFNAHLPCETKPEAARPSAIVTATAEKEKTPFTEAEIEKAKATIATSMDIPFPGLGAMVQRPYWTGRNGTFDGYGIVGSILQTDRPGEDHLVTLQPRGKRGIGNCQIQFPISVIPQVVDWLLRQQK